ncbi:hypothetical protein JCM3774_002077 [Rhodotorula dairenensis]
MQDSRNSLRKQYAFQYRPHRCDQPASRPAPADGSPRIHPASESTKRVASEQEGSGRPEKRSTRREEEVHAAQVREELAPLDPLLVSRFAGATHTRKHVEALMRRFPALSQRNFFVVQNHHATAEHFDLRLQLDNQLVSWAIPRGFGFKEDKDRNLMPDASPVRFAVETPPHYFSEAISEGKVLPRTCTALWDVGYYEIDTYHCCGDLDAADTPPGSYTDTTPAEDVSQEDKFRQDPRILARQISKRSEEDAASHRADTSILSGLTMKQLEDHERKQWAAVLEDYRKRTGKDYEEPIKDATAGSSSSGKGRSGLLECAEALARAAAVDEF